MKCKTLEEAEEHIRELDSTICSLVSKLKKLEEENEELKEQKVWWENASNKLIKENEELKLKLSRYKNPVGMIEIPGGDYDLKEYENMLDRVNTILHDTRIKNKKPLTVLVVEGERE